MVKSKTCFWLIFVLALGICASAWASDKSTPLKDKINWMKGSLFLQKEGKTPLPPYLLHSERTQRLSQVANGTGAISGYVTQAAGGAGIEGIEIIAEQMTCPSYSDTAYSNTSGDYVIDGLPPGNYEVQTNNGYPLDSIFVDVYWDNKLNEEDADTVPVASDDTTENINFSLRVGGKITGTVTLPGASTGIVIMSTVDSSGNCYYGPTYYMGSPALYVIKRLPTGTYKVKTYNFMGCIDVYYDDKLSRASADPVPVTEGATTSPVDFTLSLGGTIEGNISSASKGPLEGIDVWGSYASDPEWYSIGSTDEYGDYMLTGLRSGYWKILAYGDNTYAFEWYNDKNTWADADSQLVNAPGTISGEDFALEDGGSISGHVYSSEKGPLSGCEVVAYESSSYLQYVWISAKGNTTITDGSYQITGLRTGDYYVVAMTECDMMWYHNQTTPEQADLVHVTMPNDTSGIDFNLPSAVEDETDQTSQRPTEFELSQNYPNPFNPGTEIEYTLQKPAYVTLQIYNLLGQKVKTLVNEYQPFGSHHIVWDGKNEQGKKVTSGVYFYRLKVNELSETKRMVLLK